MSQLTQAPPQTQQQAISSSLIKSNLLQRAAITPIHGSVLQRCSNGVECPECRQKRIEREGTLQRAAVNSAPTNTVPPIVHDVLNSSGQPLDAGTRAFMEPRFGHDFSGVRVHTDARAAESARSVNALAYTVGRNVVFGEGMYAPGTGEGRRLLAHELTHVVQQGEQAHFRAKSPMGHPNDMFEREADNAAVIVTRGEVAEIGSRINTPFLQGKSNPLETLSCSLMAGPHTGMPICVNSGGCSGDCVLHNLFPLPPYCTCQSSNAGPRPPTPPPPPCFLVTDPLTGMPTCVNSGGCSDNCVLHNPSPLPPYCTCEPKSNAPITPPPSPSPPSQLPPQQAPPTPPQPTCPITPITAITDHEALNMENGVSLVWNHTAPGLQNAANTLVALIQAEPGGTAFIKSAYRPQTYQDHFFEIWSKARALQGNTDPGCNQIRTQVNREMVKHGLNVNRLVGRTSRHTSGRAVDIEWRLPHAANREARIDQLAQQAGLNHRLHGADLPHFEL